VPAAQGALVDQAAQGPPVVRACACAVTPHVHSPHHLIIRIAALAKKEVKKTQLKGARDALKQYHGG
jgi:hypothetical protein